MRLFYRACRFVCAAVCVLYLRTRLHRLHHVPRRGGVLLVSNHQSFMDPVLVAVALPREASYMARDSLFHAWGFRWLIRMLNAFPVRRGTADTAAIKETLRRLKQGEVVVVFPEGTRTEDGRIGPMLPGLATVARKCQVPIVPVLIDGMYQAWPRHRLLPKPGDVVIEYARPLWPADYADLTPEALMDRVRGALLAMQQRWHGRVPSRRLEWYVPPPAGGGEPAPSIRGQCEKDGSQTGT